MFPLQIGNEIRLVSKINAGEFSSHHREAIAQVKFHDGHLVFPNRAWKSCLLGSGEEKAVFCVCDEANRVFALEAIDQRTYLDGRFIGGTYFFTTTAPDLNGSRLHPSSLLGLTFTGLVKAREFVYGYEWARFQFSPLRQSRLDLVLTHWLQGLFAGRFADLCSRYKDVHERNVMFEIRPAGRQGVPFLARDWTGRRQRVKIGIQAIDVR
jgi:hypothetical protein